MQLIIDMRKLVIEPREAERGGAMRGGGVEGELGGCSGKNAYARTRGWVG